jgi:sialidase-1
MTCGNPCSVSDRDTGVVWLLFCTNPDNSEAPRSIWLTHSRDDGLTWGEPIDITAKVKRPDMTWYATGPGHGIQLRNGRLVVPCNHNCESGDVKKQASHIIFSDDHGSTWSLGAIAGPGTDESCVAQLDDDRLYLNSRSDRGQRRAVSISQDGGLTFLPTYLDDRLIDPNCHGGVTAVPGTACGSALLFVNPASTRRERLTARLSCDGGKTWPHAKVIHQAFAAYSDVAVAADGAILCMYERGEAGRYQTLTLARFNLAWLTADSGTAP